MPGNTNAAPSLDAESLRLEAALRQADMNVLRMTLYQLTGDPELAAMQVDRVPERGGAYVVPRLAERHRSSVLQKARDFLSRSPVPISPSPSRDHAYEMMQLFDGRRMRENELRFGLEELAFDPFPRDAKWSGKRPDEALCNFPTIIIGAGIGGIAMAVQLDRLGLPYIILEKRDDIGGTWEINNYPDARVDVTSFLYQYKFEKKYPWKSYFATRDEMKEYISHIVDKYDVRKRIRLRTEVIAASWNESSAKWNVEVKTGAGTEILEAAFVVSACGLFNKPKVPAIRGLDSFRGAIYHTTAWDRSYDYAGKRIGLIGNGSTGSQILPRIAESAQNVTLFLRTPQWIAPMSNYRGRVAAELQWLFDHVPYYWNWHCYSAYSMTNEAQYIQYHDPEWRLRGGIVSKGNDAARKFLTDYIHSKVGHNPGLFSKLVPTYAPQARRLIIDNGFYDALNRDNVTLVTDKIDRATETGVRTTTGHEYHFDLIVLASGFSVGEYLWPVEYRGRDGATVAQLWKKDGPRAYFGTTMPGFPNFFMIYGPNGQPRTGGYHSWAEIWSRYIASAIVLTIETNARSIECKHQVFETYNHRQDEEMKKIIWESDGQGGYAVAGFGRSVIHVPFITHDYHEMVFSPDPNDFVLRS